MNKSIIVVSAVLTVVCLVITGCGIGYIVGTGPMVNQTYELSGFKNIQISNAFEYDITRSDTYSVTVSAHENLIAHLDIRQDGETLIIRMKPGSYTNSETRATVSLPELNSLTVSGASRGSAKGFKSSNSLDIDLSGASQLDLEAESAQTNIDISGASKMTSRLTAGNTSLEISGASNLTGTLTARDSQVSLSGTSRFEMDGSAAEGDIEVSGASKFIGSSFKMQNATVKASGASTAIVYTGGNLNIEASGASTVKYSGGAQIKSLNVTGASQVSAQ